MAAPTLGQAYIEVHADTRPFDREIGRKVKEGVTKSEPEIGVAGEKLGKKLGAGMKKGVDDEAKKIAPGLRGTGQKIKGELGRWEKGWNETFTKMAKGNFILTRVFGQMVLGATKVTKSITKLGTNFFNLGRGITEVALGVDTFLIEGFKNLIGVGGDLAKGTTAIGAGFARMSAAMGAAVSEIASFLPAAAAVVAILGLLAAAFGALLIVIATVAAPFATLLNFALLIPAALTALLTIVLPLVLAFKDLSAVMKLVGEKDAKKFKEGMKALSPEMQTLVRVLRQFNPLFSQFKNTLQAAFFDPILKQLAPTLRLIGPELLAGLTPVAEALGALVAQVLKFIASPQIQVFIMSVLPMVAAMINAFAPQLIGILSAMAAAAQAAMPVLLELVAQFGAFLTQFAAWIQGAITDGRFETWLQNARDSLSAIWGLIQALIGLFATMFTNLRTGGQDFLKILTDAINKFTAWIKSPEGSKSMENMVRLAKAIAQAFSLALGFVQTMLTVINKIVAAYDWLNHHTPAFGIAGAAGGKFTGPLFGGLLGYSGGGVVPYDQVAMVHKGEPILDPANSMQKNQKILSDAGMLDVLTPSTEVNVFIGDEPLTRKIDYRISTNNRIQARTLAAGVRT